MSYKKLSELVHLVDIKNTDCKVTRVIGVSITKNFIPSVANLNGVDLTKYNLIKKNQFACKLMSVGRDLQLPIDLYKEDDLSLISSAYYVFEVKDENEILPDYLNMWFRRKETDRWVGYISGGDVRGGISWDMFLEMDVNVPSIEKQREIVAQYQAVENKIKVNEEICEKLEATAQTLYKQWFVDFEFPSEEGQPYKSSGGAMVYNQELEKEIPEGWEVKSLGDFVTLSQGIQVDVENQLFAKGNLNRFIRIVDYSYKSNEAPRFVNIYDDRYKVDVNDIVVIRYGESAGKICRRLEGIIANNLFKVIPNKNFLNKNIIYYYLIEPNIQNLIKSSAGSSAMPAISHGDIKQLKFCYNLNLDIYYLFDKYSSKLENKIVIKIDQNQKLTQLQSLLLSRLATLEG